MIWLYAAAAKVTGFKGRSSSPRTMSSNATMNLAEIASVWPPAPGLDQRTTGTKTTTGYHYGKIHETLTGLHDSAWWTGLQLLCPDAPDIKFHVRLRTETDIHNPFTITTAWSQTAGEWKPLPWAIPPKMATTLKMTLELTPVEVPDDKPLLVTRKIGFHELGEFVSPNGHYVFVNTHGFPLAMWDDTTSEWSGQNVELPSHERTEKDYMGHPPQWGEAHLVFPPMKCHFTPSSTWAPSMYRPTSWDDIAPLMMMVPVDEDGKQIHPIV